MRYKLIVSDLDDTLLDDNLGYPESLVEAIAEYTAAGGIFTIATGRMTEPLLDCCRRLNLKGEAISYQGAIICDIESGKILEETDISNEIAVKICRRADELGIYYQLYKDGRILIKKRTPYTERYAKLCNCPFEEYGEGLTDYVINSGLEPVKALLVDEPMKIDTLLPKLQKEFEGELLVNTSKKWIIEMINKDINKGTAVAKLAKRLGIAREEIICIGDSPNDISMVEYAGLGVCVANGNKYLKSIAGYICPSNNEGGVAHVINKFGLEKSL